MLPDLEKLDAAALCRGYTEEEGTFTCAFCGQAFEEGQVYPQAGRFYTARRAAALHVEAAHPQRFTGLLYSGSKYIGLTDNQKQLMELVQQGHSDAQIGEITGTSPATVRRQRFIFREKAKQANMYLALYAMMNEKKNPAGEDLAPGHEGEPDMDDRFLITTEEREKILKHAFSSLEPPRLLRFPVKEKKKVAILREIIKQFTHGRHYSEKEVNAILQEIYAHDYVTLRRYLVEYGYMDRTADGSDYWLR